MRTIPLFLCVTLAACVMGGCKTAPTGPPEEIAPKIVALLDQEKVGEADDLLEANDEEVLYPLLYESARGRHERGEAHGSTSILRFLARQYPGSTAVREALLYALFVERALVQQPSSELVQEIGDVLERMPQGAAQASPWVNLVQAQHAIDRGDTSGAREAFARFQKPKDETRPELVVYIEDIERYLATHP